MLSKPGINEMCIAASCPRMDSFQERRNASVDPPPEGHCNSGSFRTIASQFSLGLNLSPASQTAATESVFSRGMLRWQ